MDAQRPPAGHPVVGSWLVTAEIGGQPPVTNITTLTADGAVVNSGVPAYPAGPGQPIKLNYLSTGHGAWTSTGDRGATLTFVHLAADENGNPIGTDTVRAAIEADATGGTWSGPFTIDVVDAAGAVVASIMGTVRATRIRAEPMATSGQHQAGATP